MNHKIPALEEYAMNAFPAITTNLYDGWILRFTAGYTYRGNSINPLYPSNLPLLKKVQHCEEIYRKLKQPVVFKLSPSTPPELDHILMQRGYIIKKSADIMTKTLSAPIETDTHLVTLNDHFTPSWLEDFCVLNDTTDSKSRYIIAQSFGNIQNKTICASIYVDGTMAACGLGVLENGWIGLYDIRVKNTFRNRGFGTLICQAIIKKGQSDGVKTAYLQVASNNQIAQNLYHKLGFTKDYTYWYRVKE